MSGLDLSGKLTGTTWGTNMAGAVFSYAQMSDANLQGANLIGADFSHANLTGANLLDANIDGAIFEGADLTNAKMPPKPSD